MLRMSVLAIRSVASQAVDLLALSIQRPDVFPSGRFVSAHTSPSIQAIRSKQKDTEGMGVLLVLSAAIVEDKPLINRLNVPATCGCRLLADALPSSATRRNRRTRASQERQRVDAARSSFSTPIHHSLDAQSFTMQPFRQATGFPCGVANRPACPSNEVRTRT